MIFGFGSCSYNCLDLDQFFLLTCKRILVLFCTIDYPQHINITNINKYVIQENQSWCQIPDLH
jgi:hypothetical protein